MNMVSTKTDVKIEIFGVEYAIRTDRDPEEIKRIAQYVNDKMWEVSESNRLITTEKIAVLACLIIAEEFLELNEVNQDKDKQQELKVQKMIKILEDGRF